MESVASESQLKHGDSQISLEMPKEGLAENVKGFEQRVKEVIETTTRDCEQTKSYLITNLTELSSMHTEMADQHRLLMEQVISEEPNVKETIEALLKKISNLEKEVVSLNEKIVSLEDKNTLLKVDNIQESESDVPESQSESSVENGGTDLKSRLQWAENYIIEQNANLDTEKSKVIELENRQNQLLLLIDDLQSRFKSKEEELEESQKQLLISKDLISHLKQDQRQVDKKVLDSCFEIIDSHSKSIQLLQERITAEVSVREDQKTEFNRTIAQYKHEMTQMEVMNKMKEDIWKDDVLKLNVELTTKKKSFSQWFRRFIALIVEKRSISEQLNSLQEENCSKDDLIQELETRLDSLQIAHGGVCSLIDDVQKVNNDLTLKVAELKDKVIGSEPLFQKAQN